MGVGAGIYMYDVVGKTFTFAFSSTDEFLFCIYSTYILFDNLSGQIIELDNLSGLWTNCRGRSIYESRKRLSVCLYHGLIEH